MQITVTRNRSTKDSTVGDIAIDGERICHTLEDGFRKPKVQHFTRIWAGEYRVTLRTEGGFHGRYLKRFGPDFHKGMIWIRDIPEFEYVLVHIGNGVEDTSGCILTGFQIVEPPTADAPFRVASSEAAYRKLYPRIRDALLAGEDVRVKIIDGDREGV